MKYNVYTKIDLNDEVFICLDIFAYRLELL